MPATNDATKASRIGHTTYPTTAPIRIEDGNPKSERR